MRTYTIGAVTLTVAAALATLLGACNDGSGNIPGTAGSANAGAGAPAGPAGGSGNVAGAASGPLGGSSSMAGAGDQPIGGAPPATGGTGDSGGAPPVVTGGSGGASGGAPGGAGAANGGAAGSGTVSGPFKILILSTTLEFHHDSIPDCQYMLGLESAKAEVLKRWPQATPISTAWTSDLATDDLAQFTDATLKNYAMVFSCSPTGTVFSNNPKVKDKAAAMAALQHYIEGGGAWGGVHSATDFEKTNGFPWFINTLAGAYFVDHSADGTSGTVQTESANATSPVLAGLKTTYPTQDEWYKMNRDVSAQPGFTILQRLAADNRPLTWTKEVANPAGGMGGRMFYTVRGHNQSVFKETEFRKLVLQGIQWATRR